jgi:hypothetical protein
MYYMSNMLVIKNIADNTSLFISKEGRLRNVTALASTYREEFDKDHVKWVVAAA